MYWQGARHHTGKYPIGQPPFCTRYVTRESRDCLERAGQRTAPGPTPGALLIHGPHAPGCRGRHPRRRTARTPRSGLVLTGPTAGAGGRTTSAAEQHAHRARAAPRQRHKFSYEGRKKEGRGGCCREELPCFFLSERYHFVHFTRILQTLHFDILKGCVTLQHQLQDLDVV